MALAARQDNPDKMAFQIYDHCGHGSATTPEVANAFDALLV